MINKKLQAGLLVATIIAFVTSVVTVQNDNYLALLHSIATGFVLSAIFYFIVVYLPESRRRKMIISAFGYQYKQFKKNCITTLLRLSNSQEYKNRENLLDRKKFRRYFSNDNKDGKKRWYEVADSIQSNELNLHELIYELRMFNEEIKYIRNSIYLGDTEVFNFLNRFSKSIHRMELTQPESDDIKSFCHFLWEIFTGFNSIDGYENSNYLEKMILKVEKA